MNPILPTQSKSIDTSIRPSATLPYKTADGSNLEADLMLPSQQHNQPFPVILYFHGGSWTKGNRDTVTRHYRGHMVNHFLQAGWAIASFSYRLITPEGPHISSPAADAKDAIRWTRLHGGKFNLDSSRIGLWGSSAGAHLAMLAAFSPDDAFAGDPALAGVSTQVNFVIDHYGPTDMNPLMRTDIHPLFLKLYKWTQRTKYNNRLALTRSFSGFSDETHPEKVVESYRIHSPISYINPKTPPVLICHGDADKVVPLSQSVLLAEALETHGIRHTLDVLPGADHGFHGLEGPSLVRLAQMTTEFAKNEFSIEQPYLP